MEVIHWTVGNQSAAIFVRKMVPLLTAAHFLI